MPSSQRPFFLSSFLAAFRQQTPSASTLSASSQPNKTHSHTHPHTHQHAASGSAPSGARAISTASAAASGQAASSSRAPGGVMNQLPIHSPRGTHGVPIPGAASGRRRGSDSSSEGFRDVLGGEKWYIGGRTAGGEEKFFKLGVVRRVRSNDRLSLDRLSL
ncbi:uncharacterized protein JN550_002476 [Neoarthrinium moseri]|uniref:uncharacterized protein n=1 Tax=Neoarthrinium moseri TaxID=1658444 RepID=UPI001FDD299F|nr:uncharacterized protein JN550_002476 [Neoarthrinium moseri]KAI1875047.1 hypothetical protein JN550_002476 [Neoarthrinium moseri]